MPVDGYTHFAYSQEVETIPMTVVETERFLKDVRALMPESERSELVAFVAANPEARSRRPVESGSCVGVFLAEASEAVRG